MCQERCASPHPQRDGATSSHEFSLLYRGRTSTADNLSVLIGESNVEGFLGQSLSQSKFKKKSQGFDNGIRKALGYSHDTKPRWSACRA